MTRSSASWLVVALTLASSSACKRDAAEKESWKSFAPPSSSHLDGMQLDSARRVALESATAAMQRRDLQRLKQLGTWVRGRAQVVILEPNDLQALDLAIACLEQPASAASSLAQVQAIDGGKLKEPARALCESSSSP